MVLTLADMDGQETFDASCLGTASEVQIYTSSVSICAQASSSSASLHCPPTLSLPALNPWCNVPAFECWADVQVVEESVADDDMVMIRGSSNTAAVSVLLRGANDYMLDEMDRSLHDAFCVVKRVLESGKVVPGGTAHAADPLRHALAGPLRPGGRHLQSCELTALVTTQHTAAQDTQLQRTHAAVQCTLEQKRLLVAEPKSVAACVSLC